MRDRLALTMIVLGIASGAVSVAADEVVWAQGIGSVSEDWGYGIAVDGNANLYVTGGFSETVNFGGTTLTSAGYKDVFVAKFDSRGSLQWAVRMGGSGGDWGDDIEVDGDGNVYVTGRFSGTVDFGGVSLTSAGSIDVFVLKIDGSGVVQWARRMGGGSGFGDAGFGIAVDGFGNSYVTGFFNDTASFGAFNLTSVGNMDIFVVRLDSSGSVTWARRMGGLGGDWGYGIAVDGDGNAYMTGTFQFTGDFGSIALESAGLYDIFVAKLDGNGTVEWAERWGNTLSDRGYGIEVDASGHAFVSGSYSPGAELWVTKLDSNGSVEWTTIGGTGPSAVGYDIAVDGDGNSWVMGQRLTIARLDSRGTVQWSISGGGHLDYGYGIALDDGGGVYVTGAFRDTAQLGPHHLESDGAHDIVVAALLGCNGDEPCPSCAEKGDTTCDGTVCDVFDIVAAIDDVLEATTTNEADVDCDCAVDVFDVLCMIDCALGRPSHCLVEPCSGGIPLSACESSQP